MVQLFSIGDTMCNTIESIATTIAGGLVAGGVGVALAWLQRRCDAREDFLAVIADQRAKLDRKPEDDDCFFQESLPVLSQAVHRVRRHVNPDEWSCLCKTWQDYRDQDERFLKRALRKTEPIQIFTNMKMPDVILREHLDKFESCLGRWYGVA